MKASREKIRNIGISAHIDSGKTTLTERILYYTRRIHTVHDVKDGRGPTMDFMELEKERGITIQSAATYCFWKGHEINIIDTPGHVDFTIEVERALRVLDGGVLILCAVGGVQSQSITVDRQMKRYGIPRIAFINKCDRIGANPDRVLNQMREKLDPNAVFVQLPLGLERNFQGVIDLIKMKAYTFEGPLGEEVVEREIPPEYMEEAIMKRDELLDAASLFSDELTEAILEERVEEALIHDAIRRGVLSLKLTPVFVGSAYKNRGIQPLIDGIVHYLPSPLDVSVQAFDLNRDEAPVELVPDDDKPLVMYAFKLEVSPYGQLTYFRIYQGKVRKGSTLVNMRTGQKAKVGRLGRMHASDMEEIEEASAGEIVVLFGIDCVSGDTFTDGQVRYSMASMYVPAPVISLAIKPKSKEGHTKISKALNRFVKEDPTFRAYVDEETGDTIISGMGELHLEVYLERMRREYGIDLETSPPQVAYRETITKRAYFDYTHKKQTGGAGQYGRVAGYIEPLEEGEYEFESRLTGGVIPKEFIPSCDAGFRACLSKGTLAGCPIVGVKVVLEDGAYHPVDSSDLAFKQAAIGAFRSIYLKAKPILLEPVMKVVVEAPSEFQGAVLGTLTQRRGAIISTSEDGTYTTVEAEVPLAEMFGYATVLRSATQGKGEFTMEFLRYSPVPTNIAEEIIKERRKNSP
ncbi:MAG: elongation factor G [Deltaproteobacteria bacterium]|nr:elongation factor G [Deltaproteobacteria bacterium]MBW2068811.1 elongation factor G [Deltaproteobacteria bacterium]